VSRSGAAPTDVLLAGGTVVDGTGAPPRPADVALRGGRIAAVVEPGALSAASAEVVDARGHVVCPGFIDIMSHSLWPLMIDGRSVSKLVQGVTTEVMGEGWTPAPYGGMVSEIEPPMPGVPDEWRERIPSWRRFSDWLEAMERDGVSPNIASFIGGGTVREYACGMRMGAATRDQLAVMRRVVDDAMREGAMGVAYALIYPPDAYASTDEIAAVAGVAAGHDGMYICHMRSESERLLEAIDETVEIARRSGARSEIYHLKASGGPSNWHRMEPAIERIDRARADGLPLTADMYPYAASGTGLSARLPVSLAADGRLFERLADPSVRGWVRAELARGTDEVDDPGPPETTNPIGFRLPEHAPYIGMNLAEIAAMRGQDWLDCVFDLLIAEGAEIFTIYHEIGEDNVRRQLRLPWVIVCSDGGGLDPAWAAANGPVHPRDYGTFARVLGRYVRDEGVLTLEDAVHRMSGAVAGRLRLADRGRIAAGMAADVVVLDPEGVRDRATFERPHALAEGVRDVWVNGVATVRAGEHTGALAGRFLRGPGATALMRTS
jgi:N-acyl-D-aspartate/D-glutamate deacylase